MTASSLTQQSFDYVIVGAGPFGCVCAHELTKKGNKCLVIDKRDVVGGNCYTENKNDINTKYQYGDFAVYEAIGNNTDSWHMFPHQDQDAWWGANRQIFNCNIY